jgi:hypothetical protein
MKNYYLIALIISFSFSFAQTETEIRAIKSNLDLDVLEQVSFEEIQNEIAREKRVTKFLMLNPSIERIEYSGNTIQRIYDIIEGTPIYQSTDNAEAAIGTRTNFIQVGGDMNLNLEGENMRISIWEVGGKTQSTHVEFNDTGESRIEFGDSGNDVTFHSTHVSGTLVAAGINEDAKGMAPKATLGSYTTNSVFSPLSTEIISNALLLSNHSYGVPVIGNNGTAPTWLMGAYNNDARSWDNLLHAAPTHLAVFSAGNSGNDQYSGGLADGFDKLVGEKNSKNTLTVANASSVNLGSEGQVLFGLVNMNSSSSRGPTDDGRVKPDITGMGTNIFSTGVGSDTAYGPATGTSMSAPNVAGSILLLQELYNDTNNQYMLAATAKALVCGTASDGGVNGPDATYGWGLMNSKKAAETILGEANESSLISEQSLLNGESLVFDVTASGSEDLVITIAWTDPAGNSVSGEVNNPTPRLVNDLDLRITDANGTFFPWKLNYNNLSSAATKEDNNVDNVEQVYIQNPSTDETYTVTINHKGTLDGDSQNYSIVATGLNSVSLSSAEFQATSYTMYPNPATNEVNFSFNDALDGDTNIAVYDLTGRKVAEQNYLVSGNNLKFDISNLIQGMYVVRLENKDGFLTKKLIKK